MATSIVHVVWLIALVLSPLRQFAEGARLPYPGELQTSRPEHPAGYHLWERQSSEGIGVRGRRLGQAYARPGLGDGGSNSSAASHESSEAACHGVWKHEGYSDSCAFVRSRSSCSSGTYIGYLQLHFCILGRVPWLSYTLLALWLLVLLYLLGNTAADYFCPSLQHLSRLLHLPPTVAGVTLLPLGNGAPDVFASIASFIGAGQGEVGLNSVIGAGTFVTSVVVGSVALAAVSCSETQLHAQALFRDIGFYLLAIAGLLAILVLGRVSLWGALAFTSLYLLYGIAVVVPHIANQKRPVRRLPGWATAFVWNLYLAWSRTPPTRQGEGLDWDEERDGVLEDLAAVGAERDYAALPASGGGAGEDLDTEFDFPLLPTVVEAELPQWRWRSGVAIFAHQTSGVHSHGGVEGDEGELPVRPLWGWSEAEAAPVVCSPAGLQRYFLEWPLMVPRRLTIPSAEPEQWSQTYAIASAFGAPLLLAVVWVGPGWGSMTVWVAAAGVGCVFALLAAASTSPDGPPDGQKAVPWVCGGFVMSIVWFYLIANELVAALVALGVIAGVHPALLGLTVLAWGNSMGDLVANTAIATKGGAQMAVAGCYAGPLFNMMVGTGASLVLSAWRLYPQPFVLPQDRTLYLSLGFLVANMLLACGLLAAHGFRLTRFLGLSLIALYGVFLMLRIAAVTGVVTLP